MKNPFKAAIEDEANGAQILVVVASVAIAGAVFFKALMMFL